MQQLSNGDIPSVVTERLGAAKQALEEYVSNVSDLSDATDWQTLAPPHDGVTQTYVASTAVLTGLVSARALEVAGPEAQQRGSLYPFVIGNHKTNSLLHAVEWTCNRYSSRARATHLCTATESASFAHENSSVWHALTALSLLEKWPGATADAYAVSTAAAAHASAVQEASVSKPCADLAYASFLLSLDQLPVVPSISMQEDIKLAVFGRSPAVREVGELFPKMIDLHVAQVKRQFKVPSHTDQIWPRLHGLCALFRAPDQLQFDVLS